MTAHLLLGLLGVLSVLWVPGPDLAPAPGPVCGSVAVAVATQDLQGTAEADRLYRDRRTSESLAVLDKLNLEIMRLSRVTRWVARRFMGNPALKGSSWEQARYYLQRAVELEGDVMVYRLDLARLYQTRGEASRARAQLDTLLSFPLREPFDVLSAAEATALLKRVRR